MKRIWIVLLLFSLSIISIAQPLQGNYTIGSGGIPTFNLAIDSLINNGVSGPTVFIITPGIYNESIVLPPITGASEINTITFIPKTPDSTTVTLFSDIDATIRLDGADYIRFLHFGIKTNSHHSIEFLNEANNNIVSNCIVEGDITSSTSTDRALIYSAAHNDTNNVFQNTHFIGGSYGFYYIGSTNHESSTLIYNNILDGQFYQSIHLSNQSNPIIKRNIISPHSSATRAIYISGSDKVYVEQNKTFEGSIMLESCYSTLENESRIINNFVKSKNASCIVQSNSDYLFCLNNSTYLYGTTTARGAFYSNNTENAIIRNNIFASFGSGCSYYIHDGSVNSDNNLLFTNNNLACDNGTYLTDLAEWVNNTGNDIISIESEPQYFSASDFHLLQSEIDGLAIPYSFLEEDIDGEIRNSLYPDIGADEFTIVGLDKYYSKQDGISIHPNPVKEYLFVSVNVKENVDIKFEIYNLQGKMVSSFSRISMKKEKNSYKFDLNKNIEEGIYLLKVSYQNKSYTSKLIVQN